MTENYPPPSPADHEPVNYGEPVQVVPATDGTSNESPAPATEQAANTPEEHLAAGNVANEHRDQLTDAEPAQDDAPLPEGEAPEQAEPFRADEPGTLAPGGQPYGYAVDADAPPEETGVVTADGTHESVLVRFKDVLAHVENFLARHPEVRGFEADLKSGLATIEKHGGPAPTTVNPD